MFNPFFPWFGKPIWRLMMDIPNGYQPCFVPIAVFPQVFPSFCWPTMAGCPRSLLGACSGAALGAGADSASAGGASAGGASAGAGCEGGASSSSSWRNGLMVTTATPTATPQFDALTNAKLVGHWCLVDDLNWSLVDGFSWSLVDGY